MFLHKKTSNTVIAPDRDKGTLPRQDIATPPPCYI